jgi:hypothetical protein
MAYAAWSMNESLLGMRVHDVMRSVDYAMQRQGADQQHLHMIGKGRAGLWCLYAAALDGRIASLICDESLLSYHALTQVDRYLYSGDVFVPQILLHLDLPQVAAALSPRSLTLIDPSSPMKETASQPGAQKAYQWTDEIYGLLEASNQFRIVCGETQVGLADRYIRLFR